MIITNSIGINPIPNKTSKATDGKVNSSASTGAPVETTATDHFVEINNSVSAASDIDMSKVNQVRDLLATGQLTLDADILSEAILKMHRR